MVCPHCKKHRLAVAKVPQDVVVVVPCPFCHELSVLFRKHVIPLNRRILEHGSFEERKTHLAEIIARFLESGMMPWDGGSADESSDAEDSTDEESAAADMAEFEDGISEAEVEKFVRIDLKCIDNPAYFRRHFG